MTYRFAGCVASIGLCVAVLIALQACRRTDAGTVIVDQQRLTALSAKDSRGEASSAEVLLLGRLYIAVGRSQTSLDRMDALKAGDPAIEAERQIIRGLALESLTRRGDAYAAYEAALAVSTDYPPALVRLAAYHHRSGDLVRSRRFAQEAVRAWPGAPEPWRYLYLLARTPEERSQALLGLVTADDEQHSWSAMILRDR